MNRLSQIQNSFQDFLLHSTSDIKKQIVSSEKVSADTRLEIYSHAYRSRLIEVLAKSYPILQEYMGDEQFDLLASCYIDSHSSTYRSIRWFGDQLASAIRLNLDLNEYPYLAEMAELEWTMESVFDAADAKVLTLEDMAKIPPAAWIDMQLSVHPSVHRLNFSWNVVSIWQAISQDAAPPDPKEGPDTLAWILWRKDLMSQYCLLTIEEAWAVDAMIKQVTFSEICEGLCQWHGEEEAALTAASFLKGWIVAGLIHKVYT